MGKLKDLTGNRYGRLIAIKRIGRVAHDSLWECKCDCGNIVQKRMASLEKGHTRSCGCLKLESIAKRTEQQTTHGLSGTRLHNVWTCMKNRCYDKNYHSYKYYGAKGITVCDEWKNDFIAFRKWMLENGYDENAPRGQCTIDRIDPYGNYCPENCRIVDMVVQRHNRRDSVKNDTA